MRARLLTAIAPAAAALAAGPALAHAGSQGAGWNWDPLVAVPLFAAAVLYVGGSLRLRRTSRAEVGRRGRRAAAFAAGWGVLFLALASPLDALGERLFSAHMVQHELLMLVAAPLLVLGEPLAPFLWGLPAGFRQAAGRWLGGRGGGLLRGGLGHPGVAWSLHAVALWGWHAPQPYQAAVEDPAIHLLQHASFLGSALLFWWSILDRRLGLRNGLGGVLYIFGTAVHSSVLGAFLTFATTPWYPVYLATAPEWGLSAVGDQQLGGLIMWVPAGLVYLFACLALVFRVLRDVERRAQKRERHRELERPTRFTVERGCGSWECRKPPA